MIERIARAKINLALHVTGRRSDGYHLLDTIAVFSEFGDRISVGQPDHAHGPVALSVGGPFGSGLSSGAGNLVSAAALMLRDALIAGGHHPKPVAIFLEKNLPVASGIGGGSADAASALIALCEYWDVERDLSPLAESLGADVPMCLLARPLRATGTGEKITALEAKKPLHIVLANPGVKASTPDVFAALGKRDNAPIEGMGPALPPTRALAKLRNDLQEPAITLQPVVRDVLHAIEDSGAELARMSGSGATCFGLYANHDQAEKACDAIKSEHPGWWCVATRTTVS